LTPITHKKVVLFDWGNTLMVDIPDMEGKMCNWPRVELVDGAYETLKALSKYSKIYVATNAADSSEEDIKSAFERVNLAQFIEGYLCFGNLGVRKGNRSFYDKIMTLLAISADDVAMVGDNFENDILPASSAEIDAYWLTTLAKQDLPDNVKVIRQLADLSKAP